MQYLHLLTSSDRPKEVRVIDFYENVTDEFKVQTRDIGGDWEYAETVEGTVEDAIAIALNLFKPKPKPIKEPLGVEEIKRQLRENDGIINTTISYDILDELNDVIDDIVLPRELRFNLVYLGGTELLFENIRFDPDLAVLLVDIKADISDEEGFLKD